MSTAAVRLPDFGVEYDGAKLRKLVRSVEDTFSRIPLDSTVGAYAVTGNTTLDERDELVLVDTSGGAVTVTLPAISDAMVRAKREYEIVSTDSTNDITVVPTSTDTVVGDTSVLIEVQWTALRFRATSGNWVIV